MADRNLGLVRAALARFFQRACNNVLELCRPERLRCLELSHAIVPCKPASACWCAW